MLIGGCNQTDGDATAQATSNPDTTDSETEPETSTPTAETNPMKVHYLEIVTPESESLCEQYAQLHGVTFSEPVANLGGARTAELEGGGMVGIRAPMHDAEKSVVRPYVLVEDIKATVESAAGAGAEVAVPPMEIPEHGMCAIVFHGGIECGFWQI